MKKFLTLFLALCLIASIATCFVISANAEEEFEVEVGLPYEWNDQSEKPNGAMKWRNSKGVSADGLWQYHYYWLDAPEGENPYRPLKFCGSISGFAWNSIVGGDDNGVGYARVLDVGKNFHPASKADVVKTFYCPSGGTIEIKSVLARENDVTPGGEANGTSFAIYVEDRLVYPEEGGGEYLILDSTASQEVTVRVDVAKNERVRIHVGAMGDQSSDKISMENSITYKELNDSEVEAETDTVITPSYNNGNNSNDADDNNNVGNNGGNIQNNNNNNKGGISTGAIVGIVVGAVAVVVVAAVVIIILKKKKQD